MAKRRAIVWFRQDLRIHDNEALLDAIAHAQEVIPVYVFDERIFRGHTSRGFRKTGKYRARFIIESIQDLRRSLRELGSELVVRVGKPEEILFELAGQVKSSWIFCNRERTRDEVAVQDALEKNLWSIGQEMRYSRGKMLYYTSDLPFPITQTPDSFSQFRKEVERYVPVREPLPAPEHFTPLTVALDPGLIPGLEDFEYEWFRLDPRADLVFRGGETEALKRLHYYLWESQSVLHYQQSRDNLIGADFSTKFSPWLAQGCLSPKMVYHQLRAFEEEHGRSKSTYGVFYQLLWRDFFRFMAKKYGDLIFEKGGLAGAADPGWKDDRALLQQWIDGKTGMPFIDANMREIARTGYMSNRGRRNAASYLINDLGVNWQMGAEYFESMLIDYDVASNWGNWNYLAGISRDPHDERSFNVLAQARRFDPDGQFVKRWLPELVDIPGNRIHEPEEGMN